MSSFDLVLLILKSQYCIKYMIHRSATYDTQDIKFSFNSRNCLFLPGNESKWICTIRNNYEIRLLIFNENHTFGNEKKRDRFLSTTKALLIRPFPTGCNTICSIPRPTCGEIRSSKSFVRNEFHEWRQLKCRKRRRAIVVNETARA